MDKSKIIKLAIAGVVLVVALVLVIRYFSGGVATSPDGQPIPDRPRLQTGPETAP